MTSTTLFTIPDRPVTLDAEERLFRKYENEEKRRKEKLESKNDIKSVRYKQNRIKFYMKMLFSMSAFYCMQNYSFFFFFETSTDRLAEAFIYPTN